MEYVIREERVPAAEYIEFLKHTGLGSQYPRERFAERIPVLLERAAISLTARDPDNRLIGVCLAITDFAYWLFLTDLGVVRDWVHRGVGTALHGALLGVAAIALEEELCPLAAAQAAVRSCITSHKM